LALAGTIATFGALLINYCHATELHYVKRAPTRRDVKSVWVGLRPLVKAPKEDGENTKKLSREHTVMVSLSGMVAVTGGKWTTYRAMAEDVMDMYAENSLIEKRSKGVTKHLALLGANEGESDTRSISLSPGLHSYGDEQPLASSLARADIVICEGLTVAVVRFAARFEYAITVKDVLARRSRLLFLDARLASDVAALVGQILEEENNIDPQISQFLELTARYLHLPV
jgi:glycerol-3-phosphate dehydrogenase